MTFIAVHLGLFIKPIKQSETFELFYIPTNEMIKKVAGIYKASGELNMIYHALPKVVKDQFVIEYLADELFNTNELEGVRSTKKEITESIKTVEHNEKFKKRFNSMIKSYMKIFEKDKKLPLRPKEIRAIYDEITEGEITEKELPDGEIFRKEVTNIVKKSGTGKVIHKGLVPEESINAEIEKLFTMMNDTEEIPWIIRVAIGHYYFGYIHPFYDGNGRTSRFISSLYLSKTLDVIPALSLSRGCNKYKNNYLEAFEHTNSIMNRGELNSFIDSFLDIIYSTLLEMAEELKEKTVLMENAKNKIRNDQNLADEKESRFMFILAQNNFFSNNDGLTVKELIHELELSEGTVRKVAEKLIDKSIIKKRGIRPAYYHIDDAYLES